MPLNIESYTLNPDCLLSNVRFLIFFLSHPVSRPSKRVQISHSPAPAPDILLVIIETSVTIVDRGADMSHAAEFELAQFEEDAAKFQALAIAKKWLCKLCGDPPVSRDELDVFMDNGYVCAHCEASHARFMRD